MNTRILFVCMGNICRSPTAEAVFREIARREYPTLSLEIDSAGTHGFHIGAPPDARSIEAARRRGYDLSALRARCVTHDDFHRFDWLLAMDGDNHARLRALARDSEIQRARLFLEFAEYPHRRDVPDPYYGGPEGFEEVLDLVETASRSVLDRLQQGVR